MKWMQSIAIMASWLFLQQCTFNHSENQESPMISIDVEPSENREFSYTNKKDAYFYGRTQQNTDDMWFAGWNIRGKRILSDYTLFEEDIALDRSSAFANVNPAFLTRSFQHIQERFVMIDERDIILIELTSSGKGRIGIALDTSLLHFSDLTEKGVLFKPVEDEHSIILLAPIHGVEMNYANGKLHCPANADGFSIIRGANEQLAFELLDSLRLNKEKWMQERILRTENLLQRFQWNTNYTMLDAAIPWLGATLDALITRQQGVGIYAGLPWFNQYWGRDQFITLPGACLVSGDLATAREILMNFARFQNTDTSSIYFGRIPNRAQPTDIIYNTTDGTPRFIAQVLEYIKYSGDTTVIPELYPVVLRSMEGSLRHWVDEKGYLTHEDADTWMDAKIRNTIPYSPRGNRANDIQALWYDQLRASAYFADYMKDKDHAAAWNELADQLKMHFMEDFWISKKAMLADRLTKEGIQDDKFRPNQLFCFDLIDDDLQKAALAKAIWENLVYPWGVASLSQYDEDFHPYHENWHYYHKDEAYHNGTVWIWNNGVAMQRLIESGAKNMAYELFENMNRQAVSEGAVGSLAENADALPETGKSWAKRSGTFLQAWSNAEQLRVWYQCFMGVKPDLINKKVNIKPRIPDALKEISGNIPIGDASLHFNFNRQDSVKAYSYEILNYDGVLNIEMELIKPVEIHVESGDHITIIESGKEIAISQKHQDGSVDEISWLVEQSLLSRYKILDSLFENISFAKPFLASDLKALRNYHEEALTY